ncbi:protein cycle isoform X3 [Cydia pomonella]|uniref:protein cycle isoform X3 n=1 Tax=Cydia pomonella TaxID=82600 RepID=UPI002ADD7C99|nr:protein cycle isoform X3 [Cydia pomonella]
MSHAHDFPRVHDFYLQLHDLHHPNYHYELPLAPNASSAPPYELTASAGSCADAGGALLPAQPHQPHSSQPRHDPRKRKDKHFGADRFEMSSCEPNLHATAIPSSPSSNRKRKGSSYGAGSACGDDDGDDDTRSTLTMPDKKQNHSEIEKRRRDKMNTYITELSAMIPMCGAMARKLDKLTVLRMAVQHLRSVRGALSACPLTARPRPAFLSERELNELILQAAHDCFLLVVGCDRGRLLYVSASVKKMLQYDQSELVGQSLFDILHPKDVAKVKEQLSSSYLSPRERLIDAKTMLPVKADLVAGASRLCPGARRSFLCRIKCKLDSESPQQPPLVKEEADPSKMRKKVNEKKFCVVQCTGYLKLAAPVEVCVGGGESGDDGDCSMSCLVAIGRALPDPAPAAPRAPAPPTRRLQFVSRHATDGKFVFVDQRVTLALGFLPQELLDTSLYEYVGAGALGAVARAHKAALLSRQPLLTPPFTFRRKDGSLARVQTHFKPFKNPWTKDIEYLVANNTILGETDAALIPDSELGSFDVYKHKANVAEAGASTNEDASDFQSGVSELDLEMQRLIDSQVDSHKIGSAIATEALRRSPPGFSPDLPPDVLQDAVFLQQPGLVDNIFGVEMGNFNQVRNNVSLSAAGGESPPVAGAELTGSPPSVSPPLQSLGLDGNGEAAMAVIMSLLEADAGLGGPVNFSGLPWPLP